MTSRLGKWPDPPSAQALHGLSGEFVRLVSPHTEADNVALLVQFLVMFGSVSGRGAHFVAESDRHYANLNAVLVGETAKGRKGSAHARVRSVFETLDAEWATSGLQSGLSSGEGLIWAVRDPVWRPVKGVFTLVDAGVEDKRLLVVEPEFASPLRVARREGNTLSPTLRQAWDSGRLQTLTKNSPAIATSAHIALLAHITRDELLRYLDRTELGNGFANRFLWLCVRRSKVLPDGGQVPPDALAAFQRQLGAAVTFARELGETALTRDPEARELWHQVYGSLSAGHPGLLGAVTSRAEAQVMRLALVYALLDQSVTIRRPHLEAALEIWRYAFDSVLYIFGEASGDPVADAILDALRTHPDGMTRSELRDHFARHVASDQMQAALATLLGRGLVRLEAQSTGGRPAERWSVVTQRGDRAESAQGAVGE